MKCNSDPAQLYLHIYKLLSAEIHEDKTKEGYLAVPPHYTDDMKYLFTCLAEPLNRIVQIDGTIVVNHWRT